MGPNKTKKEPVSIIFAKVVFGLCLLVSFITVAGTSFYAVTKKNEAIQTNFKFTEKDKKTFSCGTSTAKDIDGNIYNTVQIGEQCWMKENLKVTKNPEGEKITRYCYDDDESICETDGGLYDWNTAMNGSTEEGAQGICSDGWHIPKDLEWHILENYLTDKNQTCRAPKSSEWDCKTAGTKLKIEGSSGFNGILTGERDSNGMFRYQGGGVAFWSSTEFIPSKIKNDKEVEKKFGSNGNYKYAWTRGLSSWSSVSRNVYEKASGLSIRCLKD